MSLNVIYISHHRINKHLLIFHTQPQDLRSNRPSHSALKCGIEHAKVNVLVVGDTTIITRPGRKVNSVSRASEDCERQNEDNDLSTTVESRRDEVIVLVEQGRVFPAQPALCSNAQDKVGQDRTVDAHEQPAHVPENDGQIHVAEELDLGVSVGKVEG